MKFRIRQGMLNSQGPMVEVELNYHIMGKDRVRVRRAIQRC